MRSFSQRIMEEYGSLENYYKIYPERKIVLYDKKLKNKKNNYQKFNKESKRAKCIGTVNHHSNK